MGEGRPWDGAVWSPWVTFETARGVSPRRPGVFMARERESGRVVDVGVATGERGIRGWLTAYEHDAADWGAPVRERATSDPGWLSGLAVTGGRAHGAVTHPGRLEVCWAVTVDARTAAALEERVAHDAALRWACSGRELGPGT